MDKFYTGIGNRNTPKDIKNLCTEIALHMSDYNYVLRTGACSEADKSFEVGAEDKREVYVPWTGWNGLTGISSFTPESLALAKQVWKHRKIMAWIDGEEYDSYMTVDWDSIHVATRALLSKTMCMVLGKSLSSPSQALICWTPNYRIVGISAHPITLALLSGIPVFNLAHDGTRKLVVEMLRKNEDPSVLIERKKNSCKSVLEISGLSLENLMLSVSQQTA